MKMRISKFIFLMALLFTATACSLTPDYQRPEVSTPAWKEGVSSENTAIAADWWEEFGSSELNALMQQALAQNNDLQASLQRIEQARAGLQIAGASLLPSASATASYMNGPQQAFNITDRRNKGVPEFTGDAGISYELDRSCDLLSALQFFPEHLKGHLCELFRPRRALDQEVAPAGGNIDFQRLFDIAQMRVLLAIKQRQETVIVEAHGNREIGVF